MKDIVIKLLFKSLTIDNISALVAKCIVWLLEYSREKEDKYWDKAKAVIRKINNWCSLFLEVYEDDELTSEEEEKIVEAIKNETELQSIAEILKKRLNKKRQRSSTSSVQKIRSAKAEKKETKRVAKKIKEAVRKEQKEI